MEIEIFKTGEHTDASGANRAWSENDLLEIVSMYNNQSDYEAPCVVGHPVLTSPAYAIVKSLRTDKGVLFAELINVDENFAKLVNEKRFKSVSIALYDNLLLRHVGFLGAIPPAVKGLKPPQFNSTNYNEIEITININEIENKHGDKIMFKKFTEELLNWISQTFNAETSTQVAAQIDVLIKNYPELESVKSVEPAPADKPAEASITASEFSELTKLKNRIKDLEFNEFFDTNIKAGKVTPAQKEIYKSIYNQIDISKGFEFNENGKNVTLNSKDTLDKLINSYGNVINFNEIASNKNAALNDKDSLKDNISKSIESFNQNRGVK